MGAYGLELFNEVPLNVLRRTNAINDFCNCSLDGHSYAFSLIANCEQFVEVAQGCILARRINSLVELYEFLTETEVMISVSSHGWVTADPTNERGTLTGLSLCECCSRIRVRLNARN